MTDQKELTESLTVYDKQRQQIARMMEQNSHIIEQTSQDLEGMKTAQLELQDAYRYITSRQIVETLPAVTEKKE